MTNKYFELAPSEIIQDINHISFRERVLIREIELWVHPNVYPSDRFRSSHFILETIESMVSDKTICDMGCGMGVIGQFALHNGAKRIVQADINVHAIENAIDNRELHGFSEKQLSIYESDCFDNVPKEKFDLIIFNIPFHSEQVIIKNPLERAFHDPGFC